MHANWATVFSAAQPAEAAAPPAAEQSAEGVPTEGAPSGPKPVGPMAACGNDPTMLIMLFAMIAVFYFLIIRPQQKKAKEHQGMLNELKKGDEVVTAGGMVGKVTGLSDKLLTLEVSEKVRVRVLKTQIVDKFTG
jgi:preprotein translocase subunit YajC